MDMQVETIKKITLVLNEREADWLKGLMQNPIRVDNSRDEDYEDRAMRTLFWKVLDGTRVM